VPAAQTGWTPARTGWDAEEVEVSRHLAALARARFLIAAIVISMTAAVFVVSSFVPEAYESRARIVMDDRPGAFEPGDVETVKRRLATVREVLLTREVLERAASRLGDESPETLEDKVTSSVDRDANFVNVRAVDASAEGAAAIANAVARSFLAIDAAAERQRLARARIQLLRSLDQARASAERRVIRERLSELSISEAGVGSDLVLAEPARAPTEASSPRPIRNAVFAFFASVFLAVLVALALGQLAPRVTGGRELSRLTGAPIVAAVPAKRRRGGERHVAAAAYRELRRSLAVQLPDDVKVVLVAGVLPGGAAAGVAVALAQSLADGGSRTLLISADLRRPGVHELLGVERSPGLADLLGALRGNREASPETLLEEMVVTTAPHRDGIDVLSAGTAADNPAQLLAGEAMVELVTEVERSDYRHVVVEGPPLLGTVDGPLVARYADGVLAVCQLDRMTPADAAELGEVLRGLETRVVGLVALGVRGHAHSVTVTPWPREAGFRVDA
jgi:Mrp family chromosome partitioning ATPase/capsular polysaccharide biosynthesis protein